MRRYALRRMAYLPLIVFVVSIITFFVLRLPWSRDPTDVYVNMQTTPEQEAAIRKDLGIDKPAWEQFLMTVSRSQLLARL